MMGLFKLCLAFSLLGEGGVDTSERSSFADASGWVALEEKVRRPLDCTMDEDPSAWVVFSKQMEKEAFMVRFPEDPQSQSIGVDSFVFSAQKEDVEFSLSVVPFIGSQSLEERVWSLFSSDSADDLEVVQEEAGVFHATYRSEGKWVRQTFRLSENYLYLFKTKSPFFDRSDHDYFSTFLE